MLNRTASLAMSTSVLKALPGKLDIKRHSPSIFYFLRLYEGHLESSWHGIITPQCVDEILSNNTFLESRIQRLLDGLIFVEKELGVHVRRMLKMSRGLYTGRHFKQNTWKKVKEIWGPYLRS